LPDEERIDLVVGAQTSGAQKNFQNLTQTMSDGDKVIQQMRQQFQDLGVAVDALKVKSAANRQAQASQQDSLGRLVSVSQDVTKAMSRQSQQTADLTQNTQTAAGSSGLGGLLGVAKLFFSNAAVGQQGISGLVSTIGMINPVASMAAKGIMGIINALKNLVKEAIPVIAHAQTLQITLESLAALELVKAGQFENAGDALDTAKVAAQGLLKELRLIDIESPFDSKQVQATFQSGMAYGFTADQAMKLTRASLNMAAGLGKSGAEMTMIGMVMGQVRSVGTLLTQDLRQLQSRGINLADMLKTQLGVSIEQFNAGLASGKYTMDDLLDVFDRFATTNFAGAGKRMAQTFEGLKSTLSSIKDMIFVTALKPAFDKVTAALADVVDQIQRFVFTTPIFEKIGTFLGDLVDKAVALGKAFIDWVKPGLAIFESSGVKTALKDAAMWAGMIWANLKQVGAAVWQKVKPAFDWFVSILPKINLDEALVHIKDTVNAVGQVIYSLVETIRRILTGQADTAFDPLRQAVSYVLTWIILTWDRFGANAINWGWNLVVQIANGIINAAKSVLVTAMNFLGNIIGLFIKPGSPPQKGPLSHIVEWAKGLINTYVQAFKTADFGLLRDSLAPIKQALQDAVGAGTISDVEFPTLFASVRDDVAKLISVFRETGQISDEVLGGIADKLGEGGAELTKYLRLQLMFQKAQDNLAAVSEEVAAAQKTGFVPEALVQKLKAAQESANIAEDEMAWQKEYLSLQQDSVDIQLQLVNALKKMGAALSDVAKSIKDAAAGAGMPTVTPISTGLGGPDDEDIDDIDDELTDISEALGGVSEEFQEMRKQVEDFLDLPLADKLKKIADILGLGGLLQILETFNDLPTETKISYIKDKLEKLLGIDFDTMFANLRGLPARLWQGLLRLVPKMMIMSGRFIGQIFAGVMNFISTNAPAWGPRLGEAFGKVFNFILKAIVGVAIWLVTEAPNLANAWLLGFTVVVLDWIDLVWREGPGWIKNLIKFANGFFVGFVKGFLGEAPDWVKDIVKFGEVVIQKIKDGLTEADNLLDDIRVRIVTWVASVLLRIGVWLDKVKEIGKTFVKKIKDGVDKAWDLFIWLGAKLITLVADLLRNAGEILKGLLDFGAALVQKIKDGIIAVWDMLTFFGGLFSDLWATLLGPDNDWLDGIGDIASAIINRVKAGILAGWGAFKDWFWGLLNSFGDEDEPPENTPQTRPLNNTTLPSTLSSNLTDFSALYNELTGLLSYSVLSLEAMNGQLRSQLVETRRLMSMAGIGLNIDQSYTFGDIVFPGVRDGRDAQGVERVLSRLTLQGRMTAKTTGG